jgi:Cation/multidrug efflux pump
MALFGVAVIAFSVPMYRMVRQDYLPTNVDDGQFEVRAVAPEGISLAAMDDLMQTFSSKVQSTAGVTTVLTTTAGDYNGSLSNGRIWVQMIPHEQRVFSWVRLANGIIHADPFEAFRNNFSQRDVMQKVRRQLASYKDVKFQINNIQSINLSGAGSRTDIGFVFRGPDIEKLVDYSSQLAKRGPELGLLDAQVSVQLNRPELRLQVDRSEPPISTPTLRVSLRRCV